VLDEFRAYDAHAFASLGHAFTIGITHGYHDRAH
jgi:hypothetical protein